MYDDSSCLVRFVTQTHLSLVVRVLVRDILIFLVQEGGHVYKEKFGGWCSLIPSTALLLAASFSCCEWSSWRAHELQWKDFMIFILANSLLILRFIPCMRGLQTLSYGSVRCYCVL